MQVSNINSLANTQQVFSSKNQSVDTFEKMIERQLLSMLEEQNPKEEKDPEIEKFRQDLKSYGALAFYQKLNLEKIEKLIEEKKEELKKSLGLDDTKQPPLEGQDKLDALQTLDEMLSSYTKQLLEQMQARSELEGKDKTTSIFKSLLH